DDCFLADIKVAEAADEAHAVQMTRFLLKAADQQHVVIGLELGFTVEPLLLGFSALGLSFLKFLCHISRFDRHSRPRLPASEPKTITLNAWLNTEICR